MIVSQHLAKFGSHKPCGKNRSNISRDLAKSRDQRALQFCGSFSLYIPTLPSLVVALGIGSEYIMILVCHVISQDHVNGHAT